MAGTTRLRPIVRIVLAACLAVAAMGGLAASPGSTASALSRWTGGLNLYDDGVFTTQKTWLWCTAADVQIIRNIVEGDTDHSKASQQRYFDYMRAHNRYKIPVKDGVDPAGWTAGLRRFVDKRYTLYASKSFDSALRSAVTNLRLTNLPVGITVAHGGHAWVLTGFEATADPAVTTKFRVTSVRVTGPLWGLQNRTSGYDMRPDKKLTPSQLKGFFTPWHYGGVRMSWEGRWVSVQPVPAAGTKPELVATPPPTPTPAPTPTPTLSPPLAVVLGPEPSPTPTTATVRRADHDAMDPSPNRDSALETPGTTTPDAWTTAFGGLAALLAIGLAAVGVLAVRARRMR